jgi:ketopantoate hydroxymethyltransferase
MTGAFAGDFAPKLAKRYASVAQIVIESLAEYARDKGGHFPAAEHFYRSIQTRQPRSART